MATLKEKEQLPQDILVAKQKLDDTMQGINRAKLEKEQADGDAKEAIKQAKIAQSELDVIKDLSKKEKEAFENQKQLQGEELSEIKLKNQEEKQKLRVVKDDILSNSQKLEEEKLKTSSALELLKKQHQIEAKKLQDDITSLEEKKQSILSSIELWEAALLDIKSQINAWKGQLKVINNNIEEVTVEYTELVNKSSSLNKYVEATEMTIAKLDSIKNDLDNQIAALNASITQLEKDQFTMSTNVNILKEEQDALNKDKFELQRKIEANDKREEYIKSKYEQAGVFYS